MSYPVAISLAVVQNQDFNSVLGWGTYPVGSYPSNSTPTNFSGAVVTAQARQAQSASSLLILDFSSYITLGGPTNLGSPPCSCGTMTIAIPGSVTANLSPGQWWYDILVVQSGVHTYYCQGPFTIDPTASRT